MTEERPDTGPLPSVLNRLNDEADRQWQPRTPPAWVTPLGIALMIAIVAMIGVAIRLGVA